MRKLPLIACAALATMSMTACSDDDAVDSDEEARRAYLGLDTSIGKSITLGFAGFNAASSANIAPQTTTGMTTGNLTVTGQVDQGASANKGMRLYIAMVDYKDGVIVVQEDDEDVELNLTYNTDADVATQPFLSMQLKNIPTGTLEGTLVGVYHVTGDIIGDVTLNVSFAGTLQASGNDVIRVPGSTVVTGTATNEDDGVYEISLTL